MDSPPAAPASTPPAAPPPGAGSVFFSRRQQAGLIGGLFLFGLMLVLPAPEGLAPAGWRTAAVGVLMAVWWVTEALPIPATALLPLVLFPVLGVGDIRESTAPYANPLIFLFMGGFLIALGMQRWHLHKRLALGVIRMIGTRPLGIIAGFMASTAFLSLWVSNTATAMMMLPIGLSVIELVDPGKTEASSGPLDRNFSIVLLLTIAYAASIGGLGTLIGTPPNALLAGFMDETYGVRIGFARWMAFGLPLVLVALPLTFLILTRLAYPVRLREIPGGSRLIEEAYRRLGPPSRPEKTVAFVFALTALLWILQPLLEARIPGLSDAGIAMFGALLLFLIPVDWKRGLFVLDWTWAERLPWGVLILFGGGLSLAAAVSRTRLAEWIGQALSGLSGWPVLALILVACATILLLTELTSNTATAAAFLPILASVAVGIGQNPLLLVIPAALASSCAFMLPVATPPNAIVYGSNLITIPQMARAGLYLNLLFLVLITALAYTLMLLVFGVEIGVVPPWAAQHTQPYY